MYILCKVFPFHIHILLQILESYVIISHHIGTKTAFHRKSLTLTLFTVAPMKALVTERYIDWQARLRDLGVICAEITGDTDHDDIAVIAKSQVNREL